LNKSTRIRKLKDRVPAVNEENIIPTEKWLASFRDSRTNQFLNGRIFIRQFYAAGFYEAYDIVSTYAEKQSLEILWFKEKRNCGQPLINKGFPELETFCTYCNIKFNHTEPIACKEELCHQDFCSRHCMLEHHKLKHKPRL
jgi:hypothetical protein